MTPTAGLEPGLMWRTARAATQLMVLLIVLVAPLLGGWQRLDRNLMATWDGHGWDLPAGLLDRLPLGDAPSTAYDVNQLLGGGTAGDWLGVPAVDPVASLLVLATGDVTVLWAVAFLLPLLLGLLAGRAFCGWLCPFGTLSRGVQGLLERLPWRIRQLRLPRRRPLRWAVLAGTVLVGVLGVESLLYLMLPHSLVQQAAYAVWLMGGGGAALGWLLGLMLAGLVFGPTAYCATLCPTGAALSLPARARRVRVTLADPVTCGRKCHLCNTGCWLGLAPASGDPGPDCDTCARCFEACPRANLRVTSARPATRQWVAGLLAGLLSAAALTTPAHASSESRPETRDKPRVLLHATHEVDGLTVVVSAVDFSEVQLDADDARKLAGTELTFFLARGERGPADVLGREPFRDTWDGPLSVRVHLAGEVLAVDFERPTTPTSTLNRKLYRRLIPRVLGEGDAVEIAPVPGWTLAPLSFQIPHWNPGREPGRLWMPLLAGLLVFGGLLSLALAMGGNPPSADRRPGRPSGRSGAPVDG